MAIRYDKGLQNEIRKTVTNFNQKIARLEKLDKNLHLPDRASIKRIKSQATSRAELKRLLASLQRFSRRGAERTVTLADGSEISAYQLEETQRSLRRVKSSLTRQINRIGNITPRVFGVKQDATYAQMGSQQLANLKARRIVLDKFDTKSITKKLLDELQAKIDYNMMRESKKEIFMNNYMDKMLFNLGYFVGYDQDKIESIRSKLLKMNEKEFMEMFDTDLSIQAIRDYYPEVNRYNANPNAIKEEVTAIYDELYDNIDSMIEDYVK